ncbi:hypothetical protein CASFOL_038689 [Castilleja foliolosa]|uniref:MADS-box domain-containing protein n=1 Tax=Castilleja foliolosa TaxID=1961234 RepID=A0ABD3BLP0_9LAMI
MARTKKLGMQLIQDKKSRRKQLEKRKKTLEKSAMDLSTLCGVDVGMIVYGPDDVQPILIGPPGKEQVLAGLIDSYKATPSCNKVYNLSDFFKEKTEDFEGEIKKLISDGGVMAKIDAVKRKINLAKGSISNFKEFEDLDQEVNGVNFGPSMWGYNELVAEPYSVVPMPEINEQMRFDMGCLSGSYSVVPMPEINEQIRFDMGCLPMPVINEQMALDMECLSGSYGVVPMPEINDQRRFDLGWFSSNIDAEKLSSAKEWFLNQETLFGGFGDVAVV